MIGKILLYIANAFSTGIKPGETNERKVIVPKQYVKFHKLTMPEYWVDDEVVQWLDAYPESIVAQGYDATQDDYMIEFSDEDVALQFKLTFPA
jgi:hypothetical protein